MIQAEQIKRDEQHPLLKVDTGGGDSSIPQQAAVLSPGWNVTCAPKRSWLDRWPEFISACWMTLILLGITFLVFYALGMSAYRRQSLIVVKCNTSQPENNVYFHHLIPRGSYLPFMLYADYLSSMAMEYPLLQFKVYFLIDDSLRDSIYGLKHSRLFKRFGPPISDIYPGTINEKDKQELLLFQQRYTNININIIPLSHYMAMTPLRCKWKTIPTLYLPFYARIFAVWEYGGIGLDITDLNIQFNNNRVPDSRINAILRQHNDGIEEKKYIETLNTINREEQTEVFNVFQDLMSSIFNATYSLLDTPLSYIPKPQTNNIVTVSRNYRNTHDNAKIIMRDKTEDKGNEIILKDTMKNKSDSKLNETNMYGIIMNSTSDNARFIKTDPKLSLLKINENTTAVGGKNSSKLMDILENRLNKTKSPTDIPHVVLLYDLFISDDLGPSYSFPESIQPHQMKSNFVNSRLKKNTRSPYLLSISSDGTFLAATTRHHPFLGNLLACSCKRMSPRSAIRDTIMSQCSGFGNNNGYCDNIYILDL